MGAYSLSMDAAEKRKRYASLEASLVNSRSQFDAHWRDLADYMFPRRTRFFASDRNRGGSRNQNIIDSTARFSARTLQSGMHAGLTSPARPWMKLTTPDPDLAESAPIKEWLHLATRRILDVFVDSNLYNVLPTVYGDMGVFSTAAMSILEDTNDVFRAYAYPLGSFWIGQDGRGIVSTFLRKYELTVRQVVEQFLVQANGDIDWSKCSRDVKASWDRSDTERAVEITWIVKPNDEHRTDRLESKYLPFSSCHFETGGPNDTILAERGFRQFPIMAPRWDVTGEDTYGTSGPGMDCLGDVKQLQLEQKAKGRAIAKMIDPPTVGPTALRTQKTSLLAGDITYVDERDGTKGLRAIHEVRIDLSHLSEDIRDVQYRIQRSFYEDLFLMLARSDDRRGAQPPTAREVDERHEEKLIALGPVLERTNDELLNPIVDRVFDMMMQNDMLPPPPEELHGIKLKVEYISIMQQAQKLVGVVGQDRFLQSVVALAQVFPEAREKVDINQGINNYADMLGVDPRIIRTDEEADQRVAAQQKAAADAREAETAAKYGAAAKDASQAPIGQSGTLLDRLVAQGGVQ